MKALILAAGKGTRMPEYTNKHPKALVPVKGIPVLERILDSLLKTDVRDVVITTGHFADQIESFVASQKKYEDLHITFSFNPDFATTNYITSMWTAKKDLKGDDVVLFHGDMVFDQKILDGILSSKTSAVCIREGGELPQKDFKGRLKNGRVTEIGVNVWGDDVHACMPIYKWLAADFDAWMTEIGKLVAAGDTKSYAEKAFNAISDQIVLKPFIYTINDLCMEVDTMEDVKLAESLLG
jgi:choline kinase